MAIKEGQKSSAQNGVKELLQVILELVAKDIDIEEKVEVYKSLGVLIDLMASANAPQALEISMKAVESLFALQKKEPIYLAAIIYGSVIGPQTPEVF